MEDANYSVEDLVANESFQQYCVGMDEAVVRHWNDYFDMFPGQKQKAAQAKRLYRLLSGNHAPAQYNRHLKAFKSKLEGLDQQTPATRQHYAFGISKFWLAAGCIALVLTISIPAYYLYFRNFINHNVQYSSRPGEKIKIKLSDGSTVILNGGSNITLSDDFNKEDRRIKLDGEAFFDVEHNDKVPFIVEANQLVIKDLGTKFNIRAFSSDNSTEASLIEGLIEVYSTLKPDEKILLKPNQKITYPNVSRNQEPGRSGESDHVLKVGSTTKNTASNSIAETDWTQNRLTFNDENFEQIAKKMERWYGVKIIFEKADIKQYRFVGTFEDETLLEVLDFLKYSRDFNYRKEADSIIIY